MKRANGYIPPNATLIPDEKATCVFQGVHTDVWHWEQELFDGSTTTFEMTKRPDVVFILAIIDGKLLIQDEQQPHIGSFSNIPAGMVNSSDGEDELAGAKRELKEETGYEFSDWKLVDGFQPVDRVEQFLYVFVASGTYTKGDRKLDPGEKLTPPPLISAQALP